MSSEAHHLTYQTIWTLCNTSKQLQFCMVANCSHALCGNAAGHQSS